MKRLICSKYRNKASWLLWHVFINCCKQSNFSKQSSRLADSYSLRSLFGLIIWRLKMQIFEFYSLGPPIATSPLNSNDLWVKNSNDTLKDGGGSMWFYITCKWLFSVIFKWPTKPIRGHLHVFKQPLHIVWD